jgi:hypothetical protein
VRSSACNSRKTLLARWGTREALNVGQILNFVGLVGKALFTISHQTMIQAEGEFVSSCNMCTKMSQRPLHSGFCQSAPFTERDVWAAQPEAAGSEMVSGSQDQLVGTLRHTAPARRIEAPYGSLQLHRMCK